VTRRCGARHWFAYYGWPGSSAPSCRRCGAHNPRYRRDDDPYAVLTETDARDAPLSSEPDAFDLRTRRCRFCFDAVQQFRDGWANGAGQFECPDGRHHHIPALTP
jgi:hypothetical protein